MIRTLAAEEESIAEDRRTIEQYTRETKALRETIHNLRCSTPGRPFITSGVVYQGDHS